MKNCELIERLKRFDSLADVYFIVNLTGNTHGESWLMITEVKYRHLPDGMGDTIFLQHLIKEAL